METIDEADYYDVILQLEDGPSSARRLFAILDLDLVR